MCPEQKNNWLPSASLANIQLRAQVFANIRDFFTARAVLEVETPLLAHATVPDPHIASIPVSYSAPSAKPEMLYLQTSPEFAMKRLLAAGSGSIYQVCKAFRAGELGQRHNPEFTMLEWYRIDYNLQDLMAEVEQFLITIAQFPPARRMTYAEAFGYYLELEPHTATLVELAECAQQRGLTVNASLQRATKDDWLNLLMSHLIEPHLGHEVPVFIYDYPASQAALARIVEQDSPVAARFEVYVAGVELANGFHELSDAVEQRLRFQKDLAFRQQAGLPAVPVDEHLLAALAHGLPDCAGVALGIDRLLMLMTQSKNIEQVLSFSIRNA